MSFDPGHQGSDEDGCSKRKVEKHDNVYLGLIKLY